MFFICGFNHRYHMRHIKHGRFVGTKNSPVIEKGKIEVGWKENYDFDKRKDRDGNQNHHYEIVYGC